MGFLEKLFEYEYFSIILFTVIGVLTFLFILILIMGKKDAKKRNEEQGQVVQTMDNNPLPVNQINGNIVQTMPVEPMPVVQPTEIVNNEFIQPAEIINNEFAQPIVNDEFAQPIVNDEFAQPIVNNEFAQPIVNNEFAQPIAMEQPVQSFPELNPFNLEPVQNTVSTFEPEPFVQNTAIQNEMPVQQQAGMQIEEPVIASNPADDFAAFAASLGPVAQNIVAATKTVEPQPAEVMNNEFVQPITIEQPVQPIINEQPKMPEQFSSVYVNKPAEAIDTPTLVEPMVLPTELPQQIQPQTLPAMEAQVVEQPIQPTIGVLPIIEPRVPNSGFPNLEPETYDIKGN